MNIFIRWKTFSLSISSFFFGTLFGFTVVYMAVKALLKRRAGNSRDTSLFHQAILFTIITVGIISLLLSLPIADSTKSHITTLLGYMISAIVALSSATFFGNMLAGILLKIVNNFQPGDYVEVGAYTGPVSERGLFHTEIQTDDRNLITIPNLYLAINPVKVIRRSGSFITTSVSLGYDVSRLKIENCLLEAARKAGLKDPFVFITSLGDFSIVYEIHGKQEDTKRLLSSKSRLNAMVLDELHAANIEIVSPSFMNQRPVGETIFIPEDLSKEIPDMQTNLHAELKVFDKAHDAKSIEDKKIRLEKMEAKLKELHEQLKHATEEEKPEIEGLISRYTDVRDKLNDHIVVKESDLKSEK